MKTCQIYGHNGFDLCVTFNLLEFYKKLGFKTFFAEKIYEVDLLVVIRPIDTPIDLSTYQISMIHVYDYVGNTFNNFLDLIDKNKVYIFTTTEEKKVSIITNMNLNNDHVFVALPPVEINLWVHKKKKKKKYDTVHIGNYKPVTDEDEYRHSFMEYIKNNSVDIWGLGWKKESVGGKYNGKSSLFQVSNLYSQSKIALGFMYPFQRNTTYSSRFWQTTLNGCYLLSEPGHFTSIIPGIIETDYSKEDINKILTNYKFDNNLRNQAIKYWKEEYEKTKLIVQNILVSYFPKNNKTLAYSIYIRYIFINSIRKLYQNPIAFKTINFFRFI